MPITPSIALLTQSDSSSRSMCPPAGQCRWVAPGIAATMSRACSAGVVMSAPPLMTIVFAATEASVWYSSYSFRLGRKPAAVVKEFVSRADAATAAAPLRAALAYLLGLC